MVGLQSEEKSFWRESYPVAPLYPSLTDTVTVDVAIVGAGITGLTAAYLLKNAGLTVAVLEKHTVAGGTSGRTTGKVTSQHNICYRELKERFGDRTAKLYGQVNQTAIEEIERLIRKEKISCDWQRDDNYVYTTDSQQVADFRQEATIAAKHGLPATLETTTPLPFPVTSAVKFANQAKMNTQKYLLGLAGAVHGNGSYIFENNTAIGIREGRPGHVRTLHGRVLAKHIIVASSVPTLPLIARAAYALHEYPSESYIVAGTPTTKIKGMYISPDRHQYSILPITVDGQAVLLVGGEGHLWGLRGNHQARFTRLANFAEKHFGVSAIANHWSDRDYLSYDGLPVIGRLYPWSKQLYVGTAFKKWGLTNGTAAAMALRDLICGQPSAWADACSPQRLTLLNRLRNL